MVRYIAFRDFEFLEANRNCAINVIQIIEQRISKFEVKMNSKYLQVFD